MPKIVTTKEKLKINTMTLALVGVEAITHKIKTEDLEKVFDRVDLLVSIAKDSLKELEDGNNKNAVC